MKNMKTETFVNREYELSRLLAAVADNQVRVIVIEGPAGVGKTVLTRALVSKVSTTFSAVTWIDAKYHVIEKRKVDGSHLLVFDSIDAADRAAEVERQIEEFSTSTQFKIVVCGRRVRTFRNEFRLRLSGLSLEATDALLRALTKDVGRHETLIREIKEAQILTKLQGNPLLIQSLVNASLSVGVAQAARILEPSRAIDVYIHDLISDLSEDDRLVLLLASLSVTWVPRTVLDTVVPKAAVGKGTDRLIERRLLICNRNSEVSISHDLVRDSVIETASKAELERALELMDRNLLKVSSDCLQKMVNQGKVSEKLSFYLAEALIRNGLQDEAVSVYDRAQKMSEESGNLNWQSEFLLRQVTLLRSMGYFGKAKELEEKRLSIARQLGDITGQVASLCQLGIIEQEFGNYDRAHGLYEQSLEIASADGEEGHIAKSLHLIGNIEYLRGNYEEARSLYMRSLEIKQRRGDRWGTASTLHQLGIIEQNQGHYDEAKKLYYQSLDLDRILEDQEGVATTLGQLGNLEYSNGNYDEAKRFFDQSLSIFQKLGNRPGIAKGLHQLGIMEQNRGDLDEARRLYNQSLEIKQTLGDQTGIATTLGQLGALVEAEGQLKEAENYVSQSLEIFSRIGYRSMELQSTQTLARIRQKLKKT